MEYMIHMTAFREGRRIATVKFKSKTLPPELQAEIDKLSDDILAAEERKAKEEFNKTCKEIVEYLNGRTGSAFRSNTDKTKTLIRARLNEGYKLADFLTVIDKKVNEWQENEKMCTQLKPTVLFARGHFDDYLNQPDVKPKVKPGTISTPPTYDIEQVKKDIRDNLKIKYPEKELERKYDFVKGLYKCYEIDENGERRFLRWEKEVFDNETLKTTYVEVKR